MTDNMKSVTVATFHNSIAGYACANALTSYGINATIVGDHTSEFRAGGTGDVNVLVPGSQLEQAKQLLAQIKSDSIAAEDEEDDAHETSPTGWKRMLVWTILVVNLIGLFGYLFVSVFTQ